MTRSRASAKAGGSKHNRSVANYLHDHVSEFIDVAPSWGAKDKGDLVNVRTQNGRRVVVECKDYGGQIKASEWTREAEIERDNDNAFVGVVVAKRKGTTNPADQWVITTLEELAKLLKGEEL